MTLKISVTRFASLDLEWFNIYCVDVFPEGGANAIAHLEKTTRLLAERPMIGRVMGKTGRRVFSVPKTPFTLVYRVRGDLLEILRVLDQRSENDLQDILDSDQPH
jgi:plasmid stabilization system protein ParE